ncbi:MAG: DUF302 domain-containing protein [Gammaproteobacteria bacterium]|nr:DUF302 domain-containing protein [Gammaproteobacteria bacterium]
MTQPLAFEIELDQPFEAAVETVTAALKTEGFGILTTIDVKATLKQKLNEDFRPYVILGACNPPLAHRALSAEARIGVLLPCNVTVEATDSGGSLVRLGDPHVLLQVGGLDQNPAVREIADDARARLQRAARSLEQDSA